MPEGWLQRRLDTLAAPNAPSWLPRLLLASDFAFDALRRSPELLGRLPALVVDAAGPASRWQAPAAGDDFGTALRRFRQAEGVRLVARDLLELDDVAATLAGSSALADSCIALALAQAHDEIATRHGVLADDFGRPGQPVVFALGKLGGSELNFSSDVDLVFAHAGADADSDGARPLAPDAWHTRVVQRCVQLLGETTAEGFVHRVDLRLRPYGRSGKPTLPLSAMEQYFQREGRDWERYAWLKARTVAGDADAGGQFLDSLRPFVYRRYLDFAAIDALREMKAQIDLEVQRQDLEDDIKLGRGGIREIEFLVQVVQLVRGGREPGLRHRGLLPALAACAEAGFIPPERAGALRQAYLFLRRLENRLQMLRDAQTQAVPADPDDRERIALALDYPDWSTLSTELERQRDIVATEFALVLAPRRADRGSADGAMRVLWRALAEGRAGATEIEAAGVAIGDGLHERIGALARSPGVQALSSRARDRLERLMARVLERLRRGGEDEPAAAAIVDLLQVLLRRSNYLALLEQQPAALDRLFGLASDSRWLVRQVVAQPLLLDDIFDPRSPPPPTPDDIVAELAGAGAGDAGDPERLLSVLAEVRTSLHFRLGLAVVDRRLPATEVAARLATIAEAVLGRVLTLALADAARTHGWPAGTGPGHSGLALIGYGSLGAAELGFASDLDLVFVFDGDCGAAETAGPKVIEGQRFYARAVQKLIAYLAVPLPGGRLYAVDARLRPDGAKGLLVTSLEGYAVYQGERAWTWEQQALVRARPVAGDGRLAGRFTELRRKWLAQPREHLTLRKAVAEMRERLRRERDRSGPGRFDLKQGRGGLVDLEFLVQFLVLAHAAGHPPLHAAGSTGELLSRLADCGVLDHATASALQQAHEQLLALALVRTLDDRPRVLADPGAGTAAIAAVSTAWHRHLGVATPKG